MREQKASSSICFFFKFTGKEVKTTMREVQIKIYFKGPAHMWTLKIRYKTPSVENYLRICKFWNIEGIISFTFFLMIPKNLFSIFNIFFGLFVSWNANPVLCQWHRRPYNGYSEIENSRRWLLLVQLCELKCLISAIFS